MAKSIEKATDPGKPVPCCPPVTDKPVCNVLDFGYRVQREVRTKAGRNVTVELLIKARLEVCRGELTLGKLAYSTTLLPGERVRLFTRDRRNSFSFDSETNLSYRQEQSYEEQYYLSAMSEFLSDFSATEQGQASSSAKSSFSGSAEARGLLGTIFKGPGASTSGNFSAEATADYLRELKQHAESSHYRSEQATHTINSVSIGEVNTRTHVEGESEDHFESSSRLISNPNKCKAVTYYFHQLNQEQTIRFRIVQIQRRVVDQTADTRIEKRPSLQAGEVSIIPAAVLATSKQRLDVEDADRISVAKRLQPVASAGSQFLLGNQRLTTVNFAQEPLASADRQEALQLVQADLMKEGLLDRKTGEISDQTKRELAFEITTQLPTNGMFLRTCVDDCPACDEPRMEEIRLDLERKKLENKLLEKQIELLEKSQEYRCCPPVPDSSDTEA
ncbi:MAG: hypothetical protein KDC54_22070 [Lewinella sp.]|nr:hypothetical protein [Lewinella sp.]